MLGLDKAKDHKSSQEAEESARTPGEAIRMWFSKKMTALHKCMLKKAGYV